MKCTQHGFTIIELLAVVVIIVTLAGVVVSGFLEYGARQQFRTSVVELASILKETRQRTLAAETSTQFGVAFGTSSVTVFEGSYVVGSSTNRVTNFPGVTLTTSFAPATTTIVFARLTGIPNATGTIVLLHERTGASTTLTLSESGLVW